MEDKNKLTITDEDEKAVEEKLREFSVGKEKSEKDIVRLTPSMLAGPEPTRPLEGLAPIEMPAIDNMEEKITDNSFSPNYNIVFYKYSTSKKVFDFIAGFLTVFAMYCFLNVQPLIIFVIFLVGAMESVLAFKSNRMYIVWGFISGSIFSIFLALLLTLGLVYFPTNSFILKIFNFLGR